MTPEEARNLWIRAYKASRDLAEATALLNARLKVCEERFAASLPPDARGRVILRKTQGYLEHLVFRGGGFFYEHGRAGRPLNSKPLLQARREVRALSAQHLLELWKECGGAPLRRVAPSP